MSATPGSNIYAMKTTPLRTLGLLLSLTTVALTLSAQADSSPRRWALQAGIGETTLNDISPDNQKLYLSEDKGNNFYISADLFLNRRLALTAGAYLRQDGMLTDYADGIGLKTINKTGLTAGAKYYFFPTTWVVKPHIGVQLITNILNLGTSKGTDRHIASQGYPDSHLQLDYDVQCPALAISPRLGVDIHLLSTLSLCLDYSLNFGLWGHNRSEITFISGPLIGQHAIHQNSSNSSVINIGLKMDFPVSKVSSRAWNNLLMIFTSLTKSKAQR